jgi:zinc protease
MTRDEVIAYHRARYAPGQATLLVAGDVRREDLDTLVADAFNGWTGRGVDAPPPAAAADPPQARLFIVDKPGAPQSEVRVGGVGVARNTPAYFPIAVTNTLLGGSFTSRLNMKLREEKGFTYGAGTWFDMRRAPGPFEAATAVATSVTASAVADIITEIDRVRAELVPTDELSRARNYLALRLPQLFESVDDVVRRFSDLTLHDVPLDFYRAYVEDVLAVDAAAVRNAAEAHLLAERMVVVIAGDRSLIAGQLAALGLGPVVVLDPPERRVRE